MEKAAFFFDEVIGREISPDICTLTSLLKGFGFANYPHCTVELFEAMRGVELG